MGGVLKRSFHPRLVYLPQRSGWRIGPVISMNSHNCREEWSLLISTSSETIIYWLVTLCHRECPQKTPATQWQSVTNVFAEIFLGLYSLLILGIKHQLAQQTFVKWRVPMDTLCHRQRLFLLIKSAITTWYKLLFVCLRSAVFAV